MANLDLVPILMADPEKAIIDFLYLNSRLNKAEDSTALRFITDSIAEKINWEKLARYAGLFKSVTLSKRIRLFKENKLHGTP